MKYEKPSMEQIVFEIQDVIVQSPPVPGEDLGDGPGIPGKW
jgi:hypothetical protein